MTTLLHLNDLEAVLDKLDARDRAFAVDLIKQGRKRGLSVKQWPWVEKLTQKARGGESDDSSARAKRPAKVGTGIAAVFGRGASVLETVTEDGEVIRVSPAKNGSGFHVASDGGYGNNTYFGKIDLNGNFTPRDETPEGTVDALRRLSFDTDATLTAYGKLTGRCGMCGLELTNPESIERGIGPICLGKL